MERKIYRTEIRGLHFSDKKPAVGEEITIAGYLQFYDKDKRMWLPIEGSLDVYVNGRKKGRVSTVGNGYFSFPMVFDEAGEYTVEIKFAGSREYLGCGVPTPISVVPKKEKEEWKRIFRRLGLF
ncbi:MAG: hypothetical protein DRO98_03395 [Archaeoglobales archaeon]|nr:MAG: hypothetical protein DRO98_03395 [Archaeoglobales archaeon]